MCQMNSLSEMISYILKNGNEQPLVALNENMNIMHRNTYFLKVLLNGCEDVEGTAGCGLAGLARRQLGPLALCYL